MKLHPSTIRRLLATIVLPSAVLTMAAPTYAGLVHNYDLAGSLADSLGGPSSSLMVEQSMPRIIRSAQLRV
jgi:hypothetical protein